MPYTESNPETIESSTTEFLLNSTSDYVKINPDSVALSEPEAVTFISSTGKERTIEATTLATITMDKCEACHFIVVRTISGLTGVIEERDGQMISLGSIENKGSITVQMSNGTRFATIRQAGGLDKKGNDQILIEKNYTITSNDIKVTVPVREAAVRGNHTDDSDIKEHTRKWRKAKKVIAGVALAYGALQSGGLVDEVLDGFNDAHSTVFEAENHYSIGNQLDGVYNFNPEPINEANEAIDAVARTMDDLDAHNYDAIQDRAQEFLAAYPGEILAEDAIDSFSDSLEAAESLEDIKASVKTLEDFYGFTFVIPKTDSGTHVNVAMARNTIHQIQRALARLPRSLVSDSAQLRKVEIVAKEDDADFKDTSAQAYYDSYSKSITMFAKTSAGESLLAALGQVPGSQDGGHVDDNFLHELGHALADSQERLDIVNHDVLRTDTNFDDAPSFNVIHTGIDIVKGGILKHPDTISTYSRENSDENAAENIGGVLAASRNAGLAPPDHTREYTSEANKTMLRTLIGFQRMMPGLADYLVSTDPRLMDK